MIKDLLKDKVAVVTGATSGIGRAIALKFAEQGAKVAVLGTNTERGEAVVAEMENGAVFYKVDVSNHNEVKAVMKQILEHYGDIDILVNNAGITKDQLLIKMTEDDWDQVMDINVKSCYNLSQSCIRTMMRKRSGKIINISSVVGLTGNAGQVNYASSKAAVIGFTKALAHELSSRNICVNCICPGFISTKMTDEMTEAQKEMTLARIPFGRLGQPDDIAQAALFLASSQSDYITGLTMTVDGGMTMY